MIRIPSRSVGWLALTASLLTFATERSIAATYWVSPTGSSSASGADSSSNAKSLAWFNANAQPGDVCRFKSGTYSTAIFPTVNGTAGSRIRYYGFPQDPGAVVVADIQFGYAQGSYCTARWFTCPGGMTGFQQGGGTSSVGDSIVRCVTLAGGVGIHGKQSVADSLSLTGTMTDTGQSHFVDFSGSRDHYNGTIGEWSNGSLNNQLSNCVMNIVVNTTSGQGDVHGMMVATAAYNVIRNNVINITVTACQGYFFPLELYEGYNNTFLQNTWNVAMNSAPLGSRGMWSARDSSTYNRYIGNSVTITGPNQLSFMLSNPGSFAATVGHNMYANNVIRDDAPQDGLGVLYWYDGGRYDTLQYNVVTTSSGNPAVYMPNNAEATGIISRHNTYRVAGSTAADFGSASPVGAGTRFTSDIFYCGSSNSSRENLLVASGIGVDSAGVFFSLGSSSASRAISYGGSDGKPGSGAPYGFAGEAAWGSPQFADSSYANFNPALTATTLAAGAGFPDGFAGAIPFVGGSDVTPPGVVSNLALSQPGPTSLLVSWTAPGNDGSVGTASAYDLRWSRSPINATNFALATPVSPQPVPVVGGSPQSYVALNLASSTTYYFAIRAVDASGNWSAISNVPSATTSVGTDTTPPAAIRDLTAGP